MLTAATLLSGCAERPIERVAGKWGDPAAAGTPSLEFLPAESGTSGQYAGSDGCNQVGGTYTLDGSTIDLGIMRSTRMFCSGIDTWLSRAATAELSGDTIVFHAANGSRIGALTRFAA